MASPTGSYSLVALALLCFASNVRAEGPSDADRKLAQSLFDHARKMLEAGQVAEACPKFAESQRLDPAGGTLLNLALCHEREGKTASAWFEYNDSLSLALKENRQDRELIARERLAALEPRLVRISVAPVRGADIEGLEVRLDGTLLRRAAWGTPTVVDPGAHGVDARALGREPWTSTVTIAGEGQITQIEVPLLAPTPPPRPIPVPPPMPPQYAQIGVKERSPAVYFLGAAAGAGLIVGTVTGLSALRKDSDADDLCVPERQFCPRKSHDTAEEARSLAWVSTIAFGVGLAAGGAIPFVPPTFTKKRVRIGGGLGPGGFGLGLRGEL